MPAFGSPFSRWALADMMAALFGACRNLGLARSHSASVSAEVTLKRPLTSGAPVLKRRMCTNWALADSCP